MMRKCHLNTCPVGVATQDPVLRKRFVGQPEHVINFFFFVAEEVRELMAALGYRRFDEMVGQRQMLDKTNLIAQGKAEGLDFSKLFYKPEPWPSDGICHTQTQDHQLEKVLDRTFIAQTKEALDGGRHVRLDMRIANSDRSAGAMLSGEIARRYGHAGLRDEAIHIKLKGSAGQSFGAFLAKGVTLELEGEANDYVGKGLSGGRVIVYPPKEAIKIVAERAIIIGNTALYGAIAGECYFRGVAGERFAVRNSGAIAVVEGAGDHGCEYMTGGVVVVLGDTGRNFAAGMSGGVAYVYDPAGRFDPLCNKAMVELERIAPAGPANSADEPRRPKQRAVSVENNGMGDMLAFDAERLRILIERHHLHTKSARAAEILANWDVALKSFVKVMPTDYKNALLELASDRETAAAVAAE
jgi:glutamate synthase (NADPH) large chain